MGGIKRFCLIVFGLAGALCLCALALPWVGPYQSQATALMSNWYYYTTVQVVLAITALGTLVTLLRGLFTPRKRKTVVIDRTGGDQITVTTAAISSQASHVIESDGRFSVEKVHVLAKKRGNVQVDVRVRPKNTVNVAQEGSRIHDELVEGLSTICGDKVHRINLEFVEAEMPDVPAQNVLVEHLEVPASVFERAAAQEAIGAGADDGSNDITVPMGHTAWGASADDDTSEAYTIESEEE